MGKQGKFQIKPVGNEPAIVITRTAIQKNRVVYTWRSQINPLNTPMENLPSHILAPQKKESIELFRARKTKQVSY